MIMKMNHSGGFCGLLWASVGYSCLEDAPQKQGIPDDWSGSGGCEQGTLFHLLLSHSSFLSLTRCAAFPWRERKVIVLFLDKLFGFIIGTGMVHK